MNALDAFAITTIVILVALIAGLIVYKNRQRDKE